MNNCYKYNSIEELVGHLINKKGFVFRGCTNKEYKLSPGAYRECLSEDFNFNFEYIENEHEALLKLIRMYVDYKKHFEVYYFGQHHGFKTKLLDFTWNPIIALIFACAEWNPLNEEKNRNTDGILYVVNPERFNKILEKQFEDLGQLIVDCDESTIGHNDVYQKTIQFINPPKELSKRISNQESCFFLFPKICENIFEIKPEQCEEIIIIPTLEKENILSYIKNNYNLSMDNLREL